MRHNRPIGLRLLFPALLALLPLLSLGGGIATPAGAGTPPVAPVTVGPQSASEADSILILRVYFSSIAERDRLATELGAMEAHTMGGFLTIWGDQNLLNSLAARGLRVEIDMESTRVTRESIQIAENSPNVPGTFFGGYRTVEEMQSFLDAKVAAYPTLAEKVDIGDSWCKTHPGACNNPAPTWNGFDLNVLHITNQAIPGPKPVFWFDAGIHSREIATPETAMRFIDYLLNNYANNADARWLVDHHDIWVMPMLNPDGHHMVEANPNQPYSQRKNGDRDDGCTIFPPSNGQLGTDLNRNFPFLWACCGGSSGNSCSETYRGPSAGSEEETQAVMAKIRQLIPDQRGPNNSDPAPLLTTGIAQSLHSVAELNLYPWGWTTADAPNNADLANIGRHMSAVNANPPGNGYQACQPGDCLYVVDGDSFDWLYGELGAPGYTTELSGGSFYPPYNQVDAIFNENLGQLLYMSKVARTPYLTTRGPDSRSVVTNPMTVTQGSQVQLSANINYVWTGNQYLQNVAAAEYYIDTPPWAGGTGTPMAPTDGTFNSQTEGAQATIDTSVIPPGTHLVYVRGRGVNSYEGNQSWGPFTAAFLTVNGGGGTPTVVPPTATNIVPSVTPVPPTVTAIPPTVTGTAMPTGTLPVEWTTTPTRSATSVLPSATGVPPTSTSILPTVTVILPTLTSVPATGTSVPPTSTGVAPSSTAVQPSVTSVLPSATAVQSSATAQASVTAMATGTQMASTPTSVAATSTAVVCTIRFSDVPENSTFHENVRCLACRGIISGYSDGTFRPNNSITRGQIAKMVSNAAGFNDDVTGQSFEDVPASQTFYVWIERLYVRGDMGGYTCGGVGEPCGVGNRPYFRPMQNASRGQLSKIVANAADLTTVPDGQTYTDVPASNPFYVWIMQLTDLGVMSGYVCGGPGEPCDPQNRPYFRPFADVTRGQASKIVANTFYPGCTTPSRPN